MNDEYTPRGATAAILDRAYELVRGVPYSVSARWLFYRLLQEGHYSKKDDYANKFLKAVSAARHAFYNGWRPWTLADETREAIVRGEGLDSVEDWLSGMRVTCHLDKWQDQDYYVELWFEARAMADQFRHYTEHITLVPMGGQPSIPHKYECAKRLHEKFQQYQRPIVVLYFGDLDKAGGTIGEVIERDVRKWCSIDFDFIRCGLTADQVSRYNVPDNPEKPGEYQWEALDDPAAQEIIEGAMEPYLRQDAFGDWEALETKAEDWLEEQLKGLVDKWNKRYPS